MAELERELSAARRKIDALNAELQTASVAKPTALPLTPVRLLRTRGSSITTNGATSKGDTLIVMRTTDRDAGCREQYVLTPATTQSDCSAAANQTWYWDETNQTHPNFQDNFAIALAYHNSIGGLPILWWQTPFGVPSNTPGGTPGHFRDNKVDYFLKNPSELVAVGGLGVVFGAGAENQTTPSTDGGQYQTLSTNYLANPVPLP